MGITSKDKYLRPGLINPFLVRQTPAPPTTTTPPVVISHSKNHPTSNNKFPLLHNNQTQQLHTDHSQNDGPQSRRQTLLPHLRVQRRRRQTRRGRLLRHLVRTLQGHRPGTRQILRITRVQGQGRRHRPGARCPRHAHIHALQERREGRRGRRCQQESSRTGHQGQLVEREPKKNPTTPASSLSHSIDSNELGWTFIGTDQYWSTSSSEETMLENILHSIAKMGPDFCR